MSLPRAQIGDLVTVKVLYKAKPGEPVDFLLYPHKRMPIGMVYRTHTGRVAFVSEAGTLPTRGELCTFWDVTEKDLATRFRHLLRGRAKMDRVAIALPAGGHVVIPWANGNKFFTLINHTPVSGS